MGSRDTWVNCVSCAPQSQIPSSRNVFTYGSGTEVAVTSAGLVAGDSLSGHYTEFERDRHLAGPAQTAAGKSPLLAGKKKVVMVTPRTNFIFRLVECTVIQDRRVIVGKNTVASKGSRTRQQGSSFETARCII